MTIDWNIAVQIAAPIIALIVGAVLNHFLSEREKLITHYGHVSSFRLNPKDPSGKVTPIHTHSLVIRNAGRKTSKNVRVGHSFLPDFNVYPDINYSVVDLPEGGKEILFPSIVPKKEITISYLYFPPDTYNQINTHVESDEGVAKVVPVILQAQPPKYILAIIWSLLAYGVVSLIYTAYVSIS